MKKINRMLHNAGPSLFAAILCSACGGGGGGSAGHGSTNVTIGGTVSGLSRSVVLQNNLGDDLTVSASGAFTFSRPLNQGSAYSVTILRQAAAQTCVAAAASGVAATTVNTVTINCTVNASAHFIPITASPVSGTSLPQTFGLYVVPSDALDTAPILIGNEPIRVLAYATPYNLSSAGVASAGNPSSLVYMTTGAVSGNHLWVLDLSPTSRLVPRQLSSLSLQGSGAGAFCGADQFANTLSDASSTFLIVSMATDPQFQCGGGTDSFRYFLVRLSDSPTTTPVELPPVMASAIHPLYSTSGALAGIVTMDRSHNLKIYNDETFQSSTTLLTGVNYFGPMTFRLASAHGTLSATPTYSFLSVGFVSGQVSLYRVNALRQISANLSDTTAGYNNIFADTNNFYWTSFSGPSGSMLENVIQQPLNGSARRTLLSTPIGSNEPLSFMGSTGTTLLLTRGVITNQATGARSMDIQTLPVGVAGSLTTIATYDRLVTANVTANGLFLTRYTTNSGPSSSVSYSTEIRRIDGVVVQAMTNNSTFLGLADEPLMQIRNITEPGGHGGGNLALIDTSVPTSIVVTPITRLNGSAFTVPTGSAYASPIRKISSLVGVGSASGTTQYSVYLYDLSRPAVVTVTMPNANLRVPLGPFF